MQVSGKGLRNAERVVHLIVGAVLLALSFTPLGQGDVGSILRFAVAPLLAVSGLLMWQHARVTRALRSGRYPLRLS